MAAVVILVIAVFVLVGYLFLIKLQLRGINRQLERRIREHSRNPISIQLWGRELESLTCNINKCFKTEETLRLKGVQEEKKYKEMIADISHDLRTPLTSIKGYQQLMEKGELSKEQRKRLRIALSHTDELGQLIEHFFEYSYLIHAEPEIKPERINLTALVTDCILASVVTIEEKGLSVSFEENTPVFVWADREMTVRIVQNLIRNSIQHAKKRIYVAVQCKNGGEIVFGNWVEHPKDLDAERLFERFYTGDTARRKSTGLGLSIVKLLAEEMEGSVGAKLEEGVLEIWIRLPLYRGTSQTESAD